MGFEQIKVELVDYMGSDRAIVMAVSAGYTADAEGNVFSPSGSLLSTSPKKRGGHLSLTLRVQTDAPRPFVAVLAHRFVAYFFYGDEMFKNQCVRHLNDVPHDNRLVNLALGSFKDNRADIPREKISIPAKKHAYKLLERSRKLTDEAVKNLRETRKETNMPYHKLGAIFGVTAMTAHRACSGVSWGAL